MGTLSVLSVLSVVNSSHSAVGIVLRTTPPGNRELHPSSFHSILSHRCAQWIVPGGFFDLMSKLTRKFALAPQFPYKSSGLRLKFRMVDPDLTFSVRVTFFRTERYALSFVMDAHNISQRVL